MITVALALLTGCTPPDQAPPAIDLSEVPYTLRRAAGTDVLDVYFTAPGTVRDGGEDPILDDALAALIDSATVSVDLALFDYNRPTIIDAVDAAYARGVNVRFVGDGDNVDTSGYLNLAALGVPTVNRRPRDRIMHNKFVVVDSQVVWSGSTNMSENGIMRNNNNSLLIQSTELASQYELEFNQMFATAAFGRHKTDLNGYHDVPFRAHNLEFYFAPEHNPIQALVQEVNAAQTSVHFMIFSFTHADLRDALIAAQARGVEVVGIFDESQARGRYSVDEQLAAAGMPVFIDGNHNAIGFAGGKLHHKLLVIDAGGADPRTVTGSFNWSNSATHYNDENVLVVREPGLTTVMDREFCARLAEADLHPGYQGPAPTACQDPRAKVFINEFLPNPAGPDRGHEFVEIVNGSTSVVDLAGWTFGDAVRSTRHTFGATVIAPQEAIVLFDSGVHTEPRAITSSTGSLSLNNTGDRLTLADADGAPVDVVDYGPAPNGVSFNRATDGVRDDLWVRHDTLAGADASPGTFADGTAFGPPDPPVFTLVINELMPNPVGSDLGQEYVEVVNLGPDDADLTGWQLGDLSNPARHVFTGTLPVGAAQVIYDRGDHAVTPGAIASTTGTLSLNNTGDLITLTDATGAVHDEVTYSASAEGIALVRQRDGVPGSPLVNHDTVAPGGATSSPGTHTDGTAF